MQPEGTGPNTEDTQSKGLRVLLLDSPLDRDAVMSEVRAAVPGCEFLCAGTRESFLTGIADFAPGVIVCAGQTAGIDTVAALRLAHEHAPGVPLLAVAPSLDAETAVAYMKAGAWDCVAREPAGRLGAAVLEALEQVPPLRLPGRMLGDALEQTAASVVIAGPDGNIEYVNRGFETVTGYTRAEALSRNPRFLESGRHDAAFYRALWAALAAGKTWRGRLATRNRNGALLNLETAISPVRNPAGEIAHYVAVSHDVTRQLEAEAQSAQAEKLESIGRFAGGVVHDFNNLLTVIIGFAELALADLEETNPLRGTVLEIRGAGQQAATLTQQLLAFTRQQPMQLKPLDLNDVIREAREGLRRTLGPEIELATQLEPDLGSVLADAAHLHSVLANLASNARDAMANGGTLLVETCNVDLGPDYAATHPAARPGAYVLLSVSDTGVGMDEETRSRLFEPFFTAKQSQEGPGLGLAMVHGIVRQSDGWISVYSEAGLGTTFKIYLPRISAPAGGLSASAQSGTARGSETILLVEDRQAVRRLAAVALKSCGYRVLEAAGGPEALEISGGHAGPIDLLLTDMVMPRMTGAELADRLHKLRPEIKVLIMSGYAKSLVARRGLLRGEVNFIGKPFSTQALTAKVREVLGPPADAGGGEIHVVAAPPTRSAPADGARRRVLVADDARLIRRLLAQILQEAGYEVAEASDGNELLERLAASPVDLALVDLHMPGMDGVAAARLVRERHPGVKIVLMSAAFESTATEGGAFGVDALLSKPARPEVLMETVTRLVSQPRG